VTRRTTLRPKLTPAQRRVRRWKLQCTAKPLRRKKGKALRRAKAQCRLLAKQIRRDRRRRAQRPAPKPRRPAPKPTTPVGPPDPTLGRPFTRADAERLLWRAGFGPKGADADRLVGMGLQAAVLSLTRPRGAATLTGPAPTDGQNPIAPGDAWGHDHLAWLDRMVRSNQPFVERMALVLHDWFATSVSGVASRLLIDQIALFRRAGLGSFLDLVAEVTRDPAMLCWLNGVENRKGAPNENYARELMELFTLGADRGAYGEDDVRELARALTGWRADWSAEEGMHNFRFDASRADTGTKTIFKQAGRWNWQDGARMCVEHPLHPSFFVTKLWSYFVPVAPAKDVQSRLERLYVDSGYQVLPVVEAILTSRELFDGPAMVKPPMVMVAGAMRCAGRFIDTESFTWQAEGAGQRLYDPPNVAGWDDGRWLDTSTTRSRWSLVNLILDPLAITVDKTYPVTEDAATAVAKARAFWGDPALSDDTVAALHRFAAGCIGSKSWEQSPHRAMRQNALRQLIALSPDYQVS
jgi:hypothetical protein